MVTSLLPGMINSACRGTETEIAFALLSRWEQNFVYEIHTPRGYNQVNLDFKSV